MRRLGNRCAGALYGSKRSQLTTIGSTNNPLDSYTATLLANGQILASLRMAVNLAVSTMAERQIWKKRDFSGCGGRI